MRYFLCTCCRAVVKSDKPNDPNLDTGYGRCEVCKPILILDMVKYGWAGRDMTEETARAHVNHHA